MNHDRGRNGVLPTSLLGRAGVGGAGLGQRLGTAAALFSYLASPPVAALVSFLAAAQHLGGGGAWAWAIVHTLVAIVFPVAVLVAMQRRGEVADLEITHRSQRVMPLMFTLTLTGYSLFLMETGGAPALLRQLALGSSVLTAGLLLVTRHWKISVHAAGVALAGVVLWSVWGTALPLVVGCAAMAGARIHLGRHTPAQVLAGTLLGLLAGYPVLLG